MTEHTLSDGLATVHTLRGAEGYVTKQQLARHYAVHVKTIDRWAAQGMPFQVVGGRRRFRLSEVESYWRSRSG